MSVRLATKEARKSLFKYRVGAVIVKSGRVVATGHNIVNCYNPMRAYPTIHAEEKAIIQLLRDNRLDMLAGAKLYVSRILHNGNTAVSRPCSHCYSLALSVGIKEIIYTTNEGVERCKLKM
jgi:deoxycytidylate deaminase